MRLFVLLLLGAFLVIACWPLALLLLLLWPLLWLISLPFRVVGIAVHGVLALMEALFFLPARLLGWRPSRQV